MKNLLLFTLAFTPGLGWSMTEGQALASWMASCTDMGGKHLVDKVHAGDAEQTLHVLYICEREDGKQSVRIVPVAPSKTASNDNF